MGTTRKLVLMVPLIGALIPDPTFAQAQQPSVRPKPATTAEGPNQRTPSGRELIVYFVSSTSCVANTQPGFYDNVRRMVSSVRRVGRATNTHVTLTGLSVDWDSRAGVEYMQQFGEFDELVAGRNYFNSVATRLFFVDSLARAGIPQVVIIERSVHMPPRGSSDYPRFSAERIVKKVEGADAIADWVARGTPLS
jgi:hypothetical protein